MTNIVKDVCTAYIIDGMAHLQIMKESSYNTFKNFAQNMLIQVKRVFKSELRIQTVEFITAE